MHRRGIGKSELSEEVGLAHDSHELFLRDLAVTVTVGFVDHLLNFFVGHVLAELLGDSFQVFERDFACLIIVEKTERLHHFFTRVALSHFLGHHVEELGEVNHARTVLINVSNHFLDLLTLGLEAESAHSDLQFFLVNVATAISVEEVEGLLDFLLLLLGKLSSFLGASKSGFLVGL